MSKITSIKIQEKNKERCSIFIDNEYSFSLPLEIVYSSNIKVGQDISQDKINELTSLGDNSQALSKAIAYVSKNLKTKKQVKDYLSKKGYNPQTVYGVIDKLREYKYIDDVEFAKRYIESCYVKEGKKLLEYKLMTKGVSKDNIELAYSLVNVDTKESCANLAEKYLKNKEKSPDSYKKAFRYLLSKGYSYEEVESAISFIKEQ